MYAKPECLMESLDKRREALQKAKVLAAAEQVAGGEKKSQSALFTVRFAPEAYSPFPSMPSRRGVLPPARP